MEYGDTDINAMLVQYVDKPLRLSGKLLELGNQRELAVAGPKADMIRAAIENLHRQYTS